MGTISINGRSFSFSGGNVLISNGQVTINGQRFGDDLKGDVVHLKIEGNVNYITVKNGSVEVIGNVHGDVDAGGAITCGSVGKDADAGGSITCGSVKGDVDAGGSVTCGTVGGNIKAGGSVICNR